MSGYWKKVETPRKLQPENGVGVNSKWVDEGLTALFDCRQGMELISGDRATNNTSTYGTGSGGVAADFSSTANQQYAHRAAYAITGAITIVVYCDIDALTGYGPFIAKQATTTTLCPYEFRMGLASTDSKFNFVRGNNSDIETRVGAANLITAPQKDLLISLRSPDGLVNTNPVVGVNDVFTTLSVDGVGTATGNCTDNGTSAVWIGRRYDGGTQLDGRIYYIALFNRSLTDAKLKELLENKWDLYEPEVKNVWVPVSGGGGGSPTASQTETGSAADTSSISAATTAARVETGTAVETSSASVATTSAITETGSAVETSSADVGALSASQVESGSASDTSSIVMASTAARVETGTALETSSASSVTTASQVETGAALDSSSASIAGPTTTPYTVIMTNVSGTFPTGNVKIGGVVVGTCVGPQAADGASSAKLRAQYKNLAADAYRALIQPVPGSGGILGVWLYNNIVYVFRNAADGLSAVMHKSSSSGWTAVSLGRELSFTSGGTYHLSVGDTIVGEISGATAVVTSVSLESGSFDAGDASGRIIFASQTGTFGAETIKVGANLNIASISGDSSTISFSVPGGRFEFGNYNFGGSAGSTKMYGVDGKNRGFEFDGTTLTPIATGMVPDTPSHLHAHKNHLFYSFAGSAQHSGIGTPHTWTVISGAAELAMGDTITGFMSQPGADTTAAMAIFSRNSIKILYGTSSANWNLVSYRVEVGAIAHTIQQVGITLMLDDRGVTCLETTQNYGNFADAVLSKLVQSWIIARRSNSIASCVVRDKNQYRLFFTDGSGLYITMDNGKLVGMLPVTLPNILTCVCSAENNSGDENIFFGDSTGYVHQMDIGTSFDGASIEASLNLAFTNSKSPRVLKSYRNAVVEVAGQGYSEFSFSYDLGYSSTEINQPGSVLGTLALSPVTWDSGVLWDSGSVYDGVSLLPVPFDLGGDAENISISILSSGDYFTPMRFSGVLIHYTPRRLIR